jgi:hypothetical protein
MAQKAIFLSENWLKQNTPIPSNLDVKEIYPFYNVAQDKFIRDALGDNLYNALCLAIINSTLTANQITLLELIRPSLGYYIVYEALPFLSTKIKNIGVNSTADDKQTNTDIAGVSKLRKEILENAEYYMVRVQKYLCNNSALFPEYKQHNDDVSPNKTSGFTCDLYIDPNFIDEKFIKQYYRS